MSFQLIGHGLDLPPFGVHVREFFRAGLVWIKDRRQ